jgi:hypothetical protein
MRRQLLIATLINLGTLLIAFSPACAMHAQAGPEQTVRASLDVLADVIDPASQLASDGCSARKEAIVRAVEAHKVPPAAGQAQLDQAIERCNRLRFAFDTMRSLHGQGVKAVQAGDIAAAQARLSSLREAWRGLDDTPGGMGGWRDGGGGGT